MATMFEDYVLFQTTEMASHDKYMKTTRQTTEKSNTSSFLGEIDAILDLLIITFSIAILAAVVVLLLVIYRYSRNKRKSSKNVEIIRHQYRSDDDIEITPQQHSINRDDVPARQQQSSDKEFTQQKHSTNESAGLKSQPYAKNANRQEQFFELDGGNVVTNNDNIYENKQQPMFGKKGAGESEEQDKIVHYENARSWRSSRDQPKNTDNYQNTNPDLILGNEATYQNVSSMR